MSEKTVIDKFLSRKSVRWLGATFFVTLLITLVTNTFFFDTIFSACAESFRQKTGISITYADVEGNLFSGRATLISPRFTRDSNQGLDFDLTSESCSINISLLDCFSDCLVVEEASFEALAGTIERTDRDVADDGKSMPFFIENLRVSRADFKVKDSRFSPSLKSFELNVNALQSQKIHRHSLILDLLANSTASGTLNGHPAALDAGLKADDIPISLLSELFVNPPQWLSEGLVDFQLNHITSKEDGMDMQCKIVLKKFHAKIPEKLPTSDKHLAKNVVSYLNKNSNKYQMDLKFGVNNKDAEGSLSKQGNALQKALTGALKGQLRADLLSDLVSDPESAKQAISDGFSAFEQMLRGSKKGSNKKEN